jgi:hypothetical protein
MTPEEKDRNAKMTKAYSRALRRLRDVHPVRFHEMLAEEYDKVDLVVQKRLTGERKKAAQIQAAKQLLADSIGYRDEQ